MSGLVSAHAGRRAEVTERMQRGARCDQRRRHVPRSLARRGRAHRLRVLRIERIHVERVVLRDDPVGRGDPAGGQGTATHGLPHCIRERRDQRPARRHPAAPRARVVEVVRPVARRDVGDRGARGQPRERGLATSRVGHRAVSRRQELQRREQRLGIRRRNRERLEKAPVEPEHDEPPVQSRRQRCLFREPGLRGLRLPRVRPRRRAHHRESGCHSDELHGASPSFIGSNDFSRS